MMEGTLVGWAFGFGRAQPLLRGRVRALRCNPISGHVTIDVREITDETMGVATIPIRVAPAREGKPANHSEFQWREIGLEQKVSGPIGASESGTSSHWNPGIGYPDWYS